MRTRGSSPPDRTLEAPPPTSTPTPSEARAADPWAASGAWPNPFLTGTASTSPLVPYSSSLSRQTAATLAEKRAMLGAIHRQMEALQGQASLLEREILLESASPPKAIASPVLFDGSVTRGGEESVLRGLLSPMVALHSRGEAGPTPTELSLWRGVVPGLFRLF